MKIGSVRAELLRANVWTGRQDEANSRFLAILRKSLKKLMTTTDRYLEVKNLQTRYNYFTKTRIYVLTLRRPSSLTQKDTSSERTATYAQPAPYQPRL
jgi:hypothetical protein